MSNDFVLAIDMGGTNTAMALVDEEGRILGTGNIPTTGHTDLNAYIDAIYAEAKSMTDLRGDGRCLAVGMAAPAANTITGCIDGATNLPWPSPIPMSKLISEKFGIPCILGNDANGAALGEGVFGNARGMDNYFVLTLGTGVGAGVVVDGHLLSGRSGFAGEFGHVTIERNGRPCGCGRKGCLEKYCCASGVVTTALELLKKDSDSLLAEIDTDKLTSKDVYDAAEKGDALAKKVFDITGEIIGMACANFAAFCDPEAVILFGGVAQAGEYLLKPARESFDRHALHLYAGKVKFLPSGLPSTDAATLGNAAMAWKFLNENS